MRPFYVGHVEKLPGGGEHRIIYISRELMEAGQAVNDSTSMIVRTVKRRWEMNPATPWYVWVAVVIWNIAVIGAAMLWAQT